MGGMWLSCPMGEVGCRRTSHGELLSDNITGRCLSSKSCLVSKLRLWCPRIVCKQSTIVRSSVDSRVRPSASISKTVRIAEFLSLFITCSLCNSRKQLRRLTMTISGGLPVRAPYLGKQHQAYKIGSIFPSWDHVDFPINKVPDMYLIRRSWHEYYGRLVSSSASFLSFGFSLGRFLAGLILAIFGLGHGCSDIELGKCFRQ